MYGNWWGRWNTFEAVLILLLSLLLCGHVLCSRSSSAALAHNHHHHHHQYSRSNTGVVGGTASSATNTSESSSLPRLPWNVPAQASSTKDSPVRSWARGPCRYKRCGVGKECKVDGSSGLAVCSCITDCKTERKSNKPVCGTDGRLYSSYCDLRKTVCLTGAYISFSHYQHQHRDHHQDGYYRPTKEFPAGNESSNYINHKHSVISTHGGNQECFPLIQPHHYHHHAQAHHHHHHRNYQHDPDKNPLRDKDEGFLAPQSPLSPSAPLQYQMKSRYDEIHSFEYDDDDDEDELESKHHHKLPSTVPISTATTAAVGANDDNSRQWDEGNDDVGVVRGGDVDDDIDDSVEIASNGNNGRGLGFQRQRQHHRHHPHHHDFTGDYPNDEAYPTKRKISSGTTNGEVDSRHIPGHGHSVVPPSSYYDFKDHNEDTENEGMRKTSASSEEKEEEFRWRKDEDEMSEQAFPEQFQGIRVTFSPSAATNLAWKSLQREISGGSGTGTRSRSNGHWDDPDRKDSSLVSQDRPSDDYRKRRGGSALPTVMPASATSSGSSRHNVCSPQDYEMLKGELFQYDMGKLMKHIKLMTSVSNEAVADDATPHVGRNPREALGNGDAPWSDMMMVGTSSPSPPSWLNMEGDGPEADKDNLLRHIFTLLDRNHDSILEYIELYKAELENRLELQSPEKTGCQFRDFLLFDDTDHDGQLHVNEFFSSFSHFYDITMISLDKALETKHTRAFEGETVVLRCDITGSPPPYIQWKRYGTDLSQMANPGMRSYIDGTLLLTNVHMTYAGHYSCQSPRNPEVVQTHILSVETQPYVVISPKASWKQPGEDLLLICRLVLPIMDSSSAEEIATGRAVGMVNWIWLFNGIPLRELPKSDNSNKYIFENSSSPAGGITRLRLRQIYFQDMGSYSCQAENAAGIGTDTASLVVIDPNSKAEMQALHNTNVRQLLVFHRNGLASYSAENCGWLWEIFGDDILQYSKEKDTARAVCDQLRGLCDWGESVQVSPNYVYVAQPFLSRVLLIDVGAVQSVGNALASIETCANPTRLEYVPYTDQLWIRCEVKDGGQTVFSVVENASKGEHHHHHKAIQFPLQKQDDHVGGPERITDIYLPSHQDGKRGKKDCQFAYVSLSDEQSLRRIGLKTFTYHKNNSYLNLTKFSCIPHQVHYSVSCTYSIINCLDPLTRNPNGQVIVDTLSNAVRFKTTEISGTSTVSPDNRILLTEKHTGNNTHVFVQRVGAYEIHLLSHFLLSNNLTTVRVVHSTLTEAYASVAKLLGKEVILSLQTGEIQSVDDLQNMVPHSSKSSTPYSVDNAFPMRNGRHVIVMDAETLLPRCKFYEEIPELHSFLSVQT